MVASSELREGARFTVIKELKVPRFGEEDEGEMEVTVLSDGTLIFQRTLDLGETSYLFLVETGTTLVVLDEHDLKSLEPE